MGGELSKREGVLFRSFQSEARSFCCFFHRFAQIYVLITISLLDIGFKWYFMTFFFCFERVLLAMRVCTFSLRGCSRTLKTPNSPPLQMLDECCNFEHKWKIARGYISKSIRRTRLKFSPWESTAMITLRAKFNRNLKCRVLFRDFFLVDLSWNAPTGSRIGSPVIW